MRRFSFLFVLFFSVNLVAAEALIFTGDVFDKEGKTKVFTFERYRETKGDTVVDRAVYKDLSGDVQTEEKLEVKNGNLVRYDMDQKQLKEAAWIVVNGKKAEFNLKKFRKKNYPITVDKPDNLIVGLQIVPTVEKNWAELSQGKTVGVHLGVWDRQEAIAFNLVKDDGKNPKELVIKMSPASMLLRAVVSPLYFHFDKQSKELTSYVGRVTPKEKCGRSYCNIDGLVKYKKVKAVEEKK